MDQDFQGVRNKDGKTEFSIHAPKAEKVELCLFSDDEKQETHVSMHKDDNGNWHAFLNGIEEKQKYGYRTYGRYAPTDKSFFNPAKLLVDPYAIELTRSLHDISDEEKSVLTGSNLEDSAPVAPKSVVRFLDRAKLAEKYPYLYQKPHLEWGKTHIYELHIGNFSAQHPGILPDAQGRLAALSQMPDYFKSMSYNQIELMPVTPTMADWQLRQDKGLSDQWGYNPINHRAVDPRYGNIDDLLEFVNTMHKYGIEVSLDLVFNHTGEFRQNNFLISYKGLDPESYYRFSPSDGHSFVDTTGCGNGFNPNTKQGGKIIKDSLMFFAQTCGVDAFRLDLAGDCALDQNLRFDAQGNFMKIIKEVKEQTGVKMSGEPWSAVGGYFLGQMEGLYEWNDQHEKTLKKFIRGEYGQVGNLAYHMAGSRADGKINIFTKHDGATQYDWATYCEKNNFENNENNRDGTNDNHYSPSANDSVRLTKTKSAHALNILARGVPLSLSGDEIWHTQNGNNNGYARKFPICWKGLSPEQKERYLFERKINAFRQAHPAFSSVQEASEQMMPNGHKAWTWININGDEMQPCDWNFYQNRFLGYVINAQDKNGNRFDDDFFVMVSGNTDCNMSVRLPPAPHQGSWQVVFDTSKYCSKTDLKMYPAGASYPLLPHSVVVMTCKREQNIAENQKQISPVLSHVALEKTR